MSQQNPNSSTEGPIEDKALSIADAADFLAEEETQEEVLELDKGKKDKEPAETGKPTDKGDKEGKEEEKSVEEEIEEELTDDLEELDDESLELIAPVRRKEILAAYPDIFKKFPYIEKAIYREQKYGEILPTLEDAKVAVEKAETLDAIESDISTGSTELLLSQVRENDKEAFNKVIDNFLPTLFKVDQDAYYHTIGNIIKHTIISMVRDGKELGNDENGRNTLIESADALNQYIFGTKQFTHPGRLSRGNANPQDEGKNELQEQKQAFLEQQFDTASDVVLGKIDGVIKSTLDKHIDPKGSMSDYVKGHAMNDVSDKLDKAIQSDKRFMDVYDKLWERAIANNFNTESMDKIKSAYLSKARTLLPTLIRSARQEALRGKRAENTSDNKDRKGPLPVGKTRGSAASSNSGKSGADKVQIPKGMSTLDFLMSD